MLRLSRCLTVRRRPAGRPTVPGPRWRWRWARPREEWGMATAEYAIATLAACGFAGLLIVIMRSDEVRGLLPGIVQRALSTVG